MSGGKKWKDAGATYGLCGDATSAPAMGKAFALVAMATDRTAANMDMVMSLVITISPYIYIC
jgi:hypothetical protein